ncbi:MAG: portal protein [Nitrospirae bacterium]|nr:portal protein [Nitrospirota bacterium]
MANVLTDIVNRVRKAWGFKIDQAPQIPGVRESFGIFDMFGIGSIGQNLKIDNDLMVRFADYEDMDDYPIISAAYNVLSDDCTVQDYIEGKIVNIEAKSRLSKNILNKMLHGRVKIDNHLWEITRTMLKYGNDYEFIDVGEGGIKGLVYLPPPIMRRVEKGGDVAFYADLSGTATAENADMIFDRLKQVRDGAEAMGKKELAWFPHKQFIWEGWQVIHWRNRIKNRGSLYGYAYGENARWIWKRLILIEDSALVFRLTRAPSRFVYYIDVGSQSPSESLAYVEKVKQRLKRSRFVNTRTGKIDLRFNPMTEQDDIYLPVREGKITRVLVVTQ